MRAKSCLTKVTWEMGTITQHADAQRGDANSRRVQIELLARYC